MKNVRSPYVMRSEVEARRGINVGDKVCMTLLDGQTLTGIVRWRPVGEGDAWYLDVEMLGTKDGGHIIKPEDTVWAVQHYAHIERFG